MPGLLKIKPVNFWERETFRRHVHHELAPPQVSETLMPTLRCALPYAFALGSGGWCGGLGVGGQDCEGPVQGFSN